MPVVVTGVNSAADATPAPNDITATKTSAISTFFMCNFTSFQIYHNQEASANSIRSVAPNFLNSFNETYL
jgi:hypothetical protein